MNVLSRKAVRDRRPLSAAIGASKEPLPVRSGVKDPSPEIACQRVGVVAAESRGGESPGRAAIVASKQPEVRAGEERPSYS